MVAFSFRRAQEADFDLLRRLHRAGMKAHVTELWGWDDEVQDGLLRERFEPERLSVIVSGGRDIGILQVSREPGSMRLDNILIDPAWQGRGIGSAILSDLAAEARGAGTALSLSVLKPNPAKALYERMGFVVVGEDEFRYAMAYRPLAAIHLTPIDDAEAAFAQRLARYVRPGVDAAVLIGEGSNNWVYRLGLDDRAAVLKLGKPHRLPFAAKEHRKEHWCASAAGAAGVATPESLGVGAFEGRSYQIQAFSSGRAPRSEEIAAAWAAMGRWARAFHAVPVEGWGPIMAGDGVFQGAWAKHVAYNIGSLTSDDRLLALGVLDAASSGDLRRRFERLAGKSFQLGLSHGDLGLHNVLVDDGTGEPVVLIDWGSAGAYPVPHYEISEMIRADRADDAQINIFRRAYGLSDAAFAEVMADLSDLGALRDIDTLRWGLAHAPGEVDKLIGHAKRALARLRS